MSLREWLPEWRRMTLHRSDGRIYLDRWGIGSKRLGSVFLHRMDAPDPGWDLHDHPWPFVSIVLAGGYTEERCSIGDAVERARLAEHNSAASRRPGFGPERDYARGDVEWRERWSVRRMRLGECHRVVGLKRTPTWTLVLTGPVRRKPWGFYTPAAWLDQYTYDKTVRADRRDMVANDRKYPDSGR